MGWSGRFAYMIWLMGLSLVGCASKPLDDDGVGGDAVGGAGGTAGGPGRSGAGRSSGGQGTSVLPKPNGAISLSPGALAMHAHLTSPDGDELECADFDFTATLEQVDGAWVLAAAVDRSFASTTLKPIGSGFFSNTELALPIPGCCSTLYLQDIDLTSSRIEKGHLQLLTANGSGTLDDDRCSGDEILQVDVDAELSGKPDVTVPHFGLTDSAEHPLDALEMFFNEPVLADNAATLVDDADVSATLTRLSERKDHGAFWGYGMAPLLAFDRQMTLTSRGADAAGNMFDWTSQFRSLPDPGVLAAEGFEGYVPKLSGEAWEFETKTPISGAHSVAFELDGSRATFHLKNGPDGVLRFNAQNLSWLSALENEMNSGDAFDFLATLHVEAAVVGGVKIVELTVPADDSFVVDMGDTAQVVPPVPVHAFELKLPDQGTDVIVRFTLEQTDDECGLALCGEMGALVDDLRVE